MFQRECSHVGFGGRNRNGLLDRFVFAWVRAHFWLSACVFWLVYTPGTWHEARSRQITSWRKHYSTTDSLRLTQMFIATNTTTGGERRTFGRQTFLCGFWCLSQEQAIQSKPFYQKKIFICSRERTVQYGCARMQTHIQMSNLSLLIWSKYLWYFFYIFHVSRLAAHFTVMLLFN